MANALFREFIVWKWFDENYWIKKSRNFTGGAKFGPPIIQTSVKFVDLAKPYFGDFGRHFINYKALILAVSIGFN